ncbi:hypothetical protein H0B56_18325 [Haloechinothrix sp. YIM 98757]|uniref:Uncharacterized protein n=1 Tax=Haloechinothrix aidingensis TaxID=2752311 RepID=A0A838AEC8_9PSEU|nr:hypothetical protein [Haloechinothrix aidingensis]MBA0127505.1 hypothetical protein [Haloechinothrix aidingensis]
MTVQVSGDRLGTMRTVLAYVLVLVAIVVLGLGSWCVSGRHLPLAGSAGTQSSGEAGRYPSDPLAVAEIGGAQENLERVRTVEDLHGVGMLTDEEEREYARAGAERVRLVVANFDQGKATVLLARMPDAARAGAGAHALGELQRGYGFDVPVDAGAEVMAGVLPESAEARPGGRAHYASGNALVRVGFRGDDSAATREKFVEVLTAQMEVLPPHDR